MNLNQSTSPAPDHPAAGCPLFCPRADAGGMTYPILLEIKAEHFEEDEEDSVSELYINGRLRWGREKNCILEFSEADEESAGSIPMKLTVGDGELIVERGESGGSIFRFRRGQVFETAYESPFGRIHMTVLPLRVETDTHTDSGSVRLAYVVRAGDNQAVNRLEIRYHRTGARGRRKFLCS